MSGANPFDAGGRTAFPPWERALASDGSDAGGGSIERLAAAAPAGLEAGGWQAEASAPPPDAAAAAALEAFFSAEAARKAAEARAAALLFHPLPPLSPLQHFTTPPH